MVDASSCIRCSSTAKIARDLTGPPPPSTQPPTEFRSTVTLTLHLPRPISRVCPDFTEPLNSAAMERKLPTVGKNDFDSRIVRAKNHIYLGILKGTAVQSVLDSSRTRFRANSTTLALTSRLPVHGVWKPCAFVFLEGSPMSFVGVGIRASVSVDRTSFMYHSSFGSAHLVNSPFSRHRGNNGRMHIGELGWGT